MTTRPDDDAGSDDDVGSDDDSPAVDDDDDDNDDNDDNDDDSGGDDDTEPYVPKMAVISDLHIWYPDTELGDGETEPTYPALLEHEALQYIRNEGPAISRAAILDAIARGARYIVLNGDFCNAQERAVFEAFTQDLREYEAEYDVDFLFVRGNHDAVTNENHELGQTNSVNLFQGYLENEWTHSIGAQELFNYFAPFGLSKTDSDDSPEEYIHWERGPEAENGCGTIDPEDECTVQTQFNYLVEPFRDIWLLILDTNGFSTIGGGSGWEPDNFRLAKPRTWEWIQDVYQRASYQGKTVLTFGHHNLGDPLGGLTFDGLPFLDPLVFDTRHSAGELIELGLGVYVSGHLHMDYINRYETDAGTLIDIQTPALANYPVGYRLFTFDDPDTLTVETVTVRNVPDWDRYLPNYQAFAAAGEYSFEAFAVEQSPNVRSLRQSHLRASDQHENRRRRQQPACDAAQVDLLVRSDAVCRKWQNHRPFRHGKPDLACCHESPFHQSRAGLPGRTHCGGRSLG